MKHMVKTSKSGRFGAAFRRCKTTAVYPPLPCHRCVIKADEFCFARYRRRQFATARATSCDGISRLSQRQTRAPGQERHRPGWRYVPGQCDVSAERGPPSGRPSLGTGFDPAPLLAEVC
ncbi:hypothetical protein DPEC_G00320630 [Dallia pectoralis]|uniref:Uncharacterized protein n=1 Tax=Dallia pectoralis TaxID=75939 RepID=A0ACC2F9W9_DALPE|nr:hypothetical protein DPEC_G00320630 [Dallia pectoralis]